MAKAIFLDIDGTLLSFETHSVPCSTIKVLKEAGSLGYKIIIATGRASKNIQEIAEVLVVIDPFKKPHGFKTGEFGWSAKCYINNRVLSMIMSTNEKLYLQSLD